MTAERFTEENLDRRQEMLNYIYDKFISFPATDIVVDLENESDLGATKFSYYFPKGTTTPGYIDHIAGTHDIKTGQVTILYEKGKNAGRVTLIKNPETSYKLASGYVN